MSPISWLLERFEKHADHHFMVWSDRPFTYGWLLEHVQGWRERLAELPRNSVTAIEGDFSPQSVALLLALIERAAIVVPLTESVAAHREEFLEIAQVQAGISFMQKEEGALYQRPAEATHPLLRQLIEKEHPGLVLFSSGSTGKSKAALHDFIPLLEKFKEPRHSWITLTFLLFDHIGGINTLFYVLSNTGTVVSLQDRSPDAVCRAIEQHRVELLPTSPTFLNLLLISEAYRRYDLSSLQRVTYGTEVMPQSTLERIHAALPGVELQQTYGLSELGILRSRSREPDSLWVKLGGEGFETKVQDGTLWIRAASAMLGYLNHPSPFDAEGWFNTGDAVEVDGDYFRILGRQSEIINVGGEKVYPAEVEGVLLEMENVRDVAVRGQPNPITGQVVVARFNLESPEEVSELRRRVRGYCRGRLEPFKIPARIEIADQQQYSQRFKKMRRNT